MNWISMQELLRIHAAVIRETGGIPGVVNAGALESSLHRPFTAAGGSALFPNLSDKVAALVHSIIAFHPFADGNKRTAFVAADVCLKLNGMKLEPSTSAEAFFWSIARGEQDVPQIAAWLTANAAPFHEQP
ncbi:MAG: type II toxin-antitoxin system death-on-curing family toxin [Planctomycetes bacterium]|nr:type II toxin-antitoxin system death-on-curing family toxin [Planctomycetota bacterium]